MYISQFSKIFIFSIPNLLHFNPETCQLRALWVQTAPQPCEASAYRRNGYPDRSWVQWPGDWTSNCQNLPGTPFCQNLKNNRTTVSYIQKNIHDHCWGSYLYICIYISVDSIFVWRRNMSFFLKHTKRLIVSILFRWLRNHICGSLNNSTEVAVRLVSSDELRAVMYAVFLPGWNMTQSH